jgi:capsid protein
MESGKTYLVDSYGNPLSSVPENAVRAAKEEVRQLRRELLHVRGKFDAAQTTSNNINHWVNADTLDPHSAASLPVRRRLRSRSRYEVIENNPYLKGVILSLSNDFTGSGPKLQLTDKRLSDTERKKAEARYAEWAKLVKLRQKLWRIKTAKPTDGEGIWIAYQNKRLAHPVQLDFYVCETDQITSDHLPYNTRNQNEIDGVRFDEWENPLQYYLLNTHPGANWLFQSLATAYGGKWIDARYVIHWFRQDRGWLRGIPEITPSLPLCAILRRYTLAVLRAAEIAADFAAVLETEYPPNINRGMNTGQTQDDPFDMFPIEMGMFMTLPWGAKLQQLNPQQPIAVYDEFVGSIIREICRPLLVPFNISSGSSKDSNMSGAVVDTHIYKGGIEAERIDCNEDVLDPSFELWWLEAALIPGYVFENPIAVKEELRWKAPEHKWGWDTVGLDHTDPMKVAGALEILHNKGFITDRDIQETRYNRDIETWRDEIRKQKEFRDEVGMDEPSKSSSRKEEEKNSED